MASTTGQHPVQLADVGKGQTVEGGENVTSLLQAMLRMACGRHQNETGIVNTNKRVNQKNYHKNSSAGWISPLPIVCTRKLSYKPHDTPFQLNSGFWLQLVAVHHNVSPLKIAQWHYLPVCTTYCAQYSWLQKYVGFSCSLTVLSRNKVRVRLPCDPEYESCLIKPEYLSTSHWNVRDPMIISFDALPVRYGPSVAMSCSSTAERTKILEISNVSWRSMLATISSCRQPTDDSWQWQRWNNIPVTREAQSGCSKVTTKFWTDREVTSNDSTTASSHSNTSQSIRSTYSAFYEST